MSEHDSTRSLKKDLLTSDDPRFPTYVRPEWSRWLPDLNLIFRLLAGTRAMHEHVTDYIRKWEDEDPKVYLIRSKMEQVFEGLGRTLSASIGMLFAKPPAIEWPESGGAEGLMGEHWKTNIDGAGTSGSVFIKRFAEVSLRDGIGIILVDFPSAPKGPDGLPIDVNSADEERLGLRPTWARYDRGMARNWLTGKVENQDVLTQVTLYEPTYVQHGLFGVKWENRWRFLRLTKVVDIENPDSLPRHEAEWSLFRLKPDKEGSELDDFEMIGKGQYKNKDGEVADRLPLSIAYTGKKEAPLVAIPPLLGVAWANLGLWQIATNVRFYLDLVAFPQPTVIGELAMDMGMDKEGNRVQVPGSLKIGPMVVVHLSAGDADSAPSSYEFVTPDSDGFVPNEKAMQRKREDIASLGMSFLDRDKRAAETAEAKRLDANAENATLATAAQGLDDAINDAWIIHSWYLGLDPEQAPKVTLNRDFEGTVMDAQMMEAWISGVEKAGLPPSVLIEAWHQGGQIPEGVDLIELEEEMMANIAAKEAQAELDRQASLNAPSAGDE